MDFGTWGYYIGETNANNMPNGYGINLKKEKNELCECYYVNGYSQGKAIII